MFLSKGNITQSMKLRCAIHLMWLFWFLPDRPLMGSTSLLPGLTHYEGAEELQGKLVFLFRTNAQRYVPWRRDAVFENSERAASIYEFDLSKRRFKKVTDCPDGMLFLSTLGDTFCVVYQHGLLGQTTNVFVYSPLTQAKRSVNLDSAPKATVIANGHVFFQLEKWDYAQDRAATRILDYDVRTDQTHVIGFSDASQWQSQHYDHIHVPLGQTNVLHFQYRAYRKRVGEGKDYRTGVYNLNIDTGEIRWFAEVTEDTDDPSFHYRSFDGRFIFFEGPQSPLSGFSLVSSPLDVFAAELRDPKGKQARVLHTFTARSASKGGTYVLNDVSPCGRYALVRFMELRQPQSGWLSIYYLVDVSSGETRVLLRDEVERNTSSSMSLVRWVSGVERSTTIHPVSPKR